MSFRTNLRFYLLLLFIKKRTRLFLFFVSCFFSFFSFGYVSLDSTGPKPSVDLLTPSPLETRFWGQKYLDLVQGGVRGLQRG